MTDSKEVILAEGVREDLDEIDREIQVIKNRLPFLEVQRRVLLRLLDSARVVAIASDNSHTEQLQGPTGAVLAFVARHPGVTTGRIAHELENRIESESSNRKQVIYTIISQLRRADRLRVDEDGRHYIYDDDDDDDLDDE